MELTLSDMRTLLLGESTDSTDSPFVVGKWYLIRTVTMIQVGKLKWIGSSELVLENAAWVAVTDRFHECLRSGVIGEAEPFTDDCIVGRGAICDATEWRHGQVALK